MNADVLREAARVMRVRAIAATPGVWVHTYGGIYTNPTKRDLGITYDALVAEEGFDDDEAVTPTDAEHIASWHPAVALAVADWLDAEAAAHEALTLFTAAAATVEHAVNIRGAALTITKSDDGAVSMQADTSAPAFAVARAYLGGSDE